MLALKLAYRNLKGAGLRTWLNVTVLSTAYVLIIWTQGFYVGMNEQATRLKITQEIGGGQYWQKDYDPYDPLTMEDSHAPIPADLQTLITQKKATPFLIRQAVIYPEGRIQTILLKGIDPDQTILEIPSDSLVTKEKVLPVLIGAQMSKNTSLIIGDYVTMRWRDKHGTFDAAEGKIVHIMKTDVPSIDKGQLWIPIKDLQKMTRLENEATVITVSKDFPDRVDVSGWEYKDHEFLLEDIRGLVQSKTVSSLILYVILLFLAMLAIFDTQVLAIFRRRKEIGTLIALGMTRARVIFLFTLEGAMHGILAIFVGAVYGIPLLYVSAKYGIGIPDAVEGFAFALSERLFPIYGAKLVIATVVIVMLTVTIVSYLPSRKIAKLKPTDAIKGKIS
jgi:ABC-type lipoprotein release transport system permease subunit